MGIAWSQKSTVHAISQERLLDLAPPTKQSQLLHPRIDAHEPSGLRAVPRPAERRLLDHELVPDRRNVAIDPRLVLRKQCRVGNKHPGKFVLRIEGQIRPAR